MSPTVKDFLGFVVNPPPGDPTQTAQADLLPRSVVVASPAGTGTVPVADGTGGYAWVPSGSATAALTAAPVLDVGVVGQVRAGRQLALADFTAFGLSAPAGLWNLSDLSDVSGNGRTLVNKGAVPFGAGINGAAATAAAFSGSTGQALYIADTGAADPFRIATGSWGCWFRTAKRGASQTLLSKLGASGNYGWQLYIDSTSNAARVWLSADGSTGLVANAVSDVADDRWHHLVGAVDGTAVRCYVDGVLEATAPAAGTPFPSSAPFNIGALTADASTAAGAPHYGRVDEAFVTADVLSADQVRGLYCARFAHGFPGTPSNVRLRVRRASKGAALAVADFPAQPLRLHNFTAGSLADQGSGGVALTNNGAAVSVAGADGGLAGAFSFAGAQSLSSTDAGLPAGTAARSYGCWLKTTMTGTAGIVGWGGTQDVRLVIVAGTLRADSGADLMGGPYAADGQWHQVIVVEDNAAGDGVKRKLYADGRLINGSTALNPITLTGANRFRVGAFPDGTSLFTGQLDGAFVCGYALTQDQVSILYAKGSMALAPSPKNAGDHVEYVDATSVYATFDTLDSQSQLDVAVTG